MFLWTLYKLCLSIPERAYFFLAVLNLFFWSPSFQICTFILFTLTLLPLHWEQGIYRSLWIQSFQLYDRKMCLVYRPSRPQTFAVQLCFALKLRICEQSYFSFISAVYGPTGINSRWDQLYGNLNVLRILKWSCCVTEGSFTFWKLRHSQWGFIAQLQMPLRCLTVRAILVRLTERRYNLCWNCCSSPTQPEEEIQDGHVPCAVDFYVRK